MTCVSEPEVKREVERSGRGEGVPGVGGGAGDGGLWGFHEGARQAGACRRRAGGGESVEGGRVHAVVGFGPCLERERHGRCSRWGQRRRSRGQAEVDEDGTWRELGHWTWTPAPFTPASFGYEMRVFARATNAATLLVAEPGGIWGAELGVQPLVE